MCEGHNILDSEEELLGCQSLCDWDGEKQGFCGFLSKTPFLPPAGLDRLRLSIIHGSYEFSKKKEIKKFYKASVFVNSNVFFKDSSLKIVEAICDFWQEKRKKKPEKRPDVYKNR